MNKEVHPYVNLVFLLDGDTIVWGGLNNVRMYLERYWVKRYALADKYGLHRDYNAVTQQHTSGWCKYCTTVIYMSIPKGRVITEMYGSFLAL